MHSCRRCPLPRRPGHQCHPAHGDSAGRQPDGQRAVQGQGTGAILSWQGRIEKCCELASGVTLKPDLAYSELPALDLLLLPAIWRNPLPTLRQADQWNGLLRDMAAAGTRICSVGTGSYLLAEAGLLQRSSRHHALELF